MATLRQAGLESNHRATDSSCQESRGPSSPWRAMTGTASSGTKGTKQLSYSGCPRSHRSTSIPMCPMLAHSRKRWAGRDSFLRMWEEKEDTQVMAIYAAPSRGWRAMPKPPVSESPAPCISVRLLPQLGNSSSLCKGSLWSLTCPRLPRHLHPQAPDHQHEWFCTSWSRGVKQDQIITKQ